MDFVGTHDRSLDEKGRLVLPAIFRADFSEHVFLSFLPTGPCVAMHTEAGYHEMIERLRAQINAGTLGLNLLRRLDPDHRGRRPSGGAHGRCLRRRRWKVL